MEDRKLDSAIFHHLPSILVPQKMPGRLTAGPRPLKALVLVQIQPRQPVNAIP